MPEASPSNGEGTSNEAFDSERKEADTTGPQESREATSDEEEAPLPDQVSESASESEGGLPLKKKRANKSKRRKISRVLGKE